MPPSRTDRMRGRARPRVAAALAPCVLSLGALCAAPSVAAAAPDPAFALFDPAKFTRSTVIDNPYFPLAPRTQFILEGRSDRGEGRRRHRVVFTVTDLTKVIDGVRTVVMWDRDINAGKLLEEELAFMAQDDAGTVWNFGEYPEERENGRPTGAPDTWIVGRARARAGIHMHASPQLGSPSYYHGWAPAIEFFDRAKVYRMGRRTCVPAGCFDNALITDEWNPTERGAHERKYYAPGFGNVRVGFASGRERESLVLRKVRRLGAREAARVSRRALTLDRRAYRIARRVYGRTPRAQRAS
jgi:hypothetical protein